MGKKSVDNSKFKPATGEEAPPGKPKKSKFRIVLKIFLILFLLVFLIMLAGGGVAVAYVYNIVMDTPMFNPNAIRVAETSYIFDNAGNRLTTLHYEQNRTVIPVDDVPHHVRNAFIAIEDERFYEHFGIDLTGIIRALRENYRAGTIVQGASTITQQLTRNAFLTPDQTYERKIQEMWIAIEIEKDYTKDEILEMYLNLVYFGSGAYGIYAAAETYFDKKPAELTIAEGAMLAGVLNSPNANNPFNSEERAGRRMRLVLDKMEYLGLITSSQRRSADNEKLVYAKKETEDYPFPYFLNYVIHNELISKLSQTHLFENREGAYEAIYTGGLRVYTTLDVELQEHLENTLNREDLYPTTLRIDMEKFKEALAQNNNRIPADFPGAYRVDENGVPQPQAAMVLADPMTGEVKALGGGREFHRDGNEVLRYISRRQPGSSMKPIVSYAPAMEEGLFGTGSIVEDEFFEVGNYAPRSWDGQYWGPITVREALRWSRNIPPVRVLHQITPYRGTMYAEKMGISTFSDDDRGALSVPLGGVSGVTVYDMAQAFATIANQGMKQPFHTVKKVLDSSGNIVYEYRDQPEKVLSPTTAYMLTDIMEDAHRNTFTENRLYIDRPVAVKTGTTNDNRDTYLAAYTPNLLSVFWMGYDFHKMGFIHGGHGLSTGITREVFKKAFEDLPVIDFKELRPDGIIDMEVCGKTGLKPSSICYAAGTVVTEMFTAQNAPEETCSHMIDMEVIICSRSGLLAGPDCPYVETRVYYQNYHYYDDDYYHPNYHHYHHYHHIMPPTETCHICGGEHHYYHYDQYHHYDQYNYHNQHHYDHFYGSGHNYGY